MITRRDDCVSSVIGTVLIIGMVVILAAIVTPVAIAIFTDFSVQEKKNINVAIQIVDDVMSVNIINGKNADELTGYNILISDVTGQTTSSYTKITNDPDCLSNKITITPEDTTTVMVVGDFADGRTETIYSGTVKPGYILVNSLIVISNSRGFIHPQFKNF